MKMTPFKVMLLILVSPIIIFLFLLPLIVYSEIRDMRIEREGKELFSRIAAYSRTRYNFTINEEDYEIGIMGYEGGYAFKSPPPIYGLRKKGIGYKSKYFSELGEKYYRIRANNIMGDTDNFFGYNGGTTMLKIISDFGLQPYILNTLIYDKSKGNDFETIEKIFDRYEKEISYNITENIWACGDIGKKFGNGYILSQVKNTKCLLSDKEGYSRGYDYKLVEKYALRYDEYFKKPRSIETIDWEEYMKIHEIHPIMEFRVQGTEEEREELRKEIEPYYNKEILDIIIDYP